MARVETLAMEEPELTIATETLGRELIDLGRLQEVNRLSTEDLMRHWSLQVTAELAMVEQADNIRMLLQRSLPEAWLDPDQWPGEAGGGQAEAVSLRVLSHPEAHPVPVDLESPVTRRLVGRALKERYYQFKQRARRTADVDGRWWAVLTAAVWSICAKGEARRVLSATPADLDKQFNEAQARALFLATWPTVQKNLVAIWKSQRKDLGLDLEVDAPAQRPTESAPRIAGMATLPRATDVVLDSILVQIGQDPNSGGALSDDDKTMLEAAFRMLLDMANGIATDAQRTDILLQALDRKANQARGGQSSTPAQHPTRADPGQQHSSPSNMISPSDPPQERLFSLTDSSGGPGLEEVYAEVARKLAQQCQANRNITDPMVRFRLFRILLAASKVAEMGEFGDTPFKRIASMGATAAEVAA